MCGEDSSGYTHIAQVRSGISELCRREGIASNLYYRWSKDFLEAGKKRLSGDTVREANTDEVKVLRREASDLKEVVAMRAENGSLGSVPAGSADSSGLMRLR